MRPSAAPEVEPREAAAKTLSKKLMGLGLVTQLRTTSGKFSMESESLHLGCYTLSLRLLFKCFTTSILAMLTTDVSTPFRITQFPVSCPMKYFSQVCQEITCCSPVPSYQSFPTANRMHSLPLPLSKKTSHH